MDVERSDQRYHPLLVLRIVRTPLCVSRAARGSKTYYSGNGAAAEVSICALSGKYLPRGCVRWMWNDQTSGTTRFSYFV